MRERGKIPGLTWAKDFLALPETGRTLHRAFPNPRDVTREKWATIGNVAFWYHQLEIKLVTFGICDLNPLYASEDLNEPEFRFKVCPCHCPTPSSLPPSSPSCRPLLPLAHRHSPQQ